MVTKILKAPDGSPSDVERIKKESDYLRGTLKEVMLDRISAGIPDDDNRLMKHHAVICRMIGTSEMNAKSRNLSPHISLCCACVCQGASRRLNNGLSWMTCPRNTGTAH